MFNMPGKRFIHRKQKVFISTIKMGIALVCTGVLCFAQEPNFLFARQAGGQGVDNGVDIVVDGEGSVYVTGFFQGRADFENTALTSVGTSDIFLAKYDASGTLLWVEQAGGDISGGLTNERGNSVAIDSEGNVLLTGLFGGTGSFGDESITAVGQFDIFLAKYSAIGELLWVKTFGSFGNEAGFGVTTDSEDNIIVTGTFEGQFDFGGTTLNSPNNRDMFLAKYDVNGQLLWVQQSEASSEGTGFGVASDQNDNVLVTGRFEGSASFGGQNLTSSGGDDIFVAKFDRNGKIIWAVHAGGESGEAGSDVAADNDGNVYVTGSFQGTAHFDGMSLTSQGGQNMFTAKYDTNGSFQWVKQAASTGSSSGTAITSDPEGNTYVTGGFRLSATFDDTTLLGLGNPNNVYVVKYSPEGVLQWAIRAGGFESDTGWGITIDQQNNLFICGQFRGSAAFNGTTITSSGQDDIFIARLSTLE